MRGHGGGDYVTDPLSAIPSHTQLEIERTICNRYADVSIQPGRSSPPIEMGLITREEIEMEQKPNENELATLARADVRSTTKHGSQDVRFKTGWVTVRREGLNAFTVTGGEQLFKGGVAELVPFLMENYE